MIFMSENAAHEAFQKTDGGKALRAYRTKMQDAMMETFEALINYEKEHGDVAPDYMYACHSLAASAEMAAKAMYTAAFSTWLDACDHEIREGSDEW